MPSIHLRKFMENVGIFLFEFCILKDDYKDL